MPLNIARIEAKVDASALATRNTRVTVGLMVTEMGRRRREQADRTAVYERKLAAAKAAEDQAAEAAAGQKPDDSAVKTAETHVNTAAGEFVVSLAAAEGTQQSGEAVVPELQAEVAAHQVQAAAVTDELAALDPQRALLANGRSPYVVPPAQQDEGAQPYVPLQNARSEQEEQQLADISARIALLEQQRDDPLGHVALRNAATQELDRFNPKLQQLQQEVVLSKALEAQGDAAGLNIPAPLQEETKTIIGTAKSTRASEVEAQKKRDEMSTTDVIREKTPEAIKKPVGRISDTVKSGVRSGWDAMKQFGRGLPSAMVLGGIGAGIGAIAGAFLGSAGAGAAFGAAIGGAIGMRMGNVDANAGLRKPAEDKVKANKKALADKERELDMLKKEQEGFYAERGKNMANNPQAAPGPDPYPERLKTAQTAVDAAKKELEAAEKELAANDQETGKKELDAPKKK